METPLVLRAAKRALDNAEDATAALHHSDRGSQYASELLRDFLGHHGVVQSMSRRGNCYDNAAMESFWATLKTECGRSPWLQQLSQRHPRHAPGCASKHIPLHRTLLQSQTLALSPGLLLT